MIAWPPELVNDIARRRCVLFLGAGVSKNSTNAKGERPMDWKQFLNHLADQIGPGDAQNATRACIAEGDLLTACEVAKRALNPDRFRGLLLGEFAEKRFQTAPIHRDLVAIDSRLVITTNFDKLYETAANHLLDNTVLVKSYRDPDVADVIRRTNRCVLKIHGTIDVPQETIITRFDYARVRNEHASFYRVVDALFMTHTFVFLGASMADPDVRLILEDYARRYSGARPHYLVAPADLTPPHVMAVHEEGMNLRSIQYSSNDFHRELHEGIKELKLLVEAERQELLNTADW